MNRSGSDRTRMRPAKASRMNTPSVANGISWWLGTIAANAPIARASTRTRCRVESSGTDSSRRAERT